MSKILHLIYYLHWYDQLKVLFFKSFLLWLIIYVYIYLLMLILMYEKSYNTFKCVIIVEYTDLKAAPRM